MGEYVQSQKAQRHRSTLRHGWQLKQTGANARCPEWINVESVPTVVHTDLLKSKQIKDPFVDLNELEAEWIGESCWQYRTRFQMPIIQPGAKAILVFEGLDTFAEVRLDETIILRSENMFLSHEVDITSMARSEQVHTLDIVFDSALLRGRQLEKIHSEHRFIAHNGETGRLAVRKAQYHWGWDWGPVLMTAGPWRPVHLDICFARIVDSWLQADVAADLKSVKLSALVQVDGDAECTVDVSLLLSGATVLTRKAINVDGGVARTDFVLPGPALWYPRGYGDQPRYDFVTTVVSNGHILDTITKRTAFRRTELVRRPDTVGETFFFRINDIDVFCGGSCWIPADSFVSEITEKRYREWLELIANANQVMVRVWGGGIYEDDCFYDICDELGLLVWQDFMFGCGSYPVWPELLASIREEAVCNVRRLRHHPSIVVWAGNNEDYQIQEEYGLDYDMNDTKPDSWLRSSFPARYIYEYLLPDVLAKEAPSTAYWPGSPFSGGKQISDPTVGDIHQWNVWHGSQEMYQTFDHLVGRFVSELGMEAFPSLETIRSFVTDEKQLYAQSQVLDFHNKADGHERRLALYIAENFRPPVDLQSHVYITQLLQSEALMYAYRACRRAWKDRHCGGILVWQINDCWPTTSWAIVDYYRRKKPAYYSTARMIKPLAIGVMRAHDNWTRAHARPPRSLSFDVWVASSLIQDVVADVEIRFVSVASGNDIKAVIRHCNVKISANSTTAITTGQIDIADEEPHCIAVRLFVDGKVQSRDVDWPQPFKYLSFEDRELEIRKLGKQLVVQAARPVKGLCLEVEEGVGLSDNCIDIVPGDEQTIELRGADSHDECKVTTMYLGKS